MTKHSSRRSFMKTSALAGAGVWAASSASWADSKSANEQVNFACIGVGGKGRSDSTDAKKRGNVVAICDIDENTLNTAARGFRGAEKFTDYRKMLDKLGKSIDAVTVSTPDHTHAPASIMAMEMGKHCFTQKPLTHTLWEAREMGRIARENKVATQMGNQGTAESGLRKAAAMIQAGTIGTVKEVHVWTNRPVWPQGDDKPDDAPEFAFDQVPQEIAEAYSGKKVQKVFRRDAGSTDKTEQYYYEIHTAGGDIDVWKQRIDRESKKSNIEKAANWNQFLGTAPYRQHHPIYHPFKWRGWWDFGTGALGDMACHTLNMAYAALDLRDPVSVQAVTSGHNRQTFPKWSVIEYQFPERNGRPALKMVWYDGGKLPPDELLEGASRRAKSGSLLIGEKGRLHSPNDYGAAYELLGGGEEKDVDFEVSPGHFDEFVRAIKGGQPAMSNFPDYAGPLTETVLLGNLAVWAAHEAGQGPKVMWDAPNLKASGADNLDELVKKDYREEFKL